MASCTHDSLACPKDLLSEMLLESEMTIGTIGEEFQGLAGDVDSLLTSAASTLQSIDQGGVLTIPAKVQSLVKASDQFVRQRFEATKATLAAVKQEEQLLDRFSQLNSGVRSLAQEIRMLAMLTGMEAARLGSLGQEFQYLSGELRSFAETVAQNANDLNSQARERRLAIRESERKLANAMPRIIAELERVDATFATTLSEIQLSVQELVAYPARFHMCLASVAAQIDGVVRAIQSQDITRQQAEHVRESLQMLLDGRDPPPTFETPDFAICLTIQIHQLRNIKEAMEDWAAQIQTCLSGLLSVSCFNVATIGPLVLDQEESLQCQVLRVRDLEEECEKDSEEVAIALRGLSNLVQTIAENYENARLIRDRMQLLSFNSRIEAGSAGRQATVMVEISKNITRVAGAWDELTDRSERTVEEMSNLAAQSAEEMKLHGGKHGLEAAQVEIREALTTLRRAAESAAGNASRVTATMAGLQAKIENLRSKAQQLNQVIARVGQVLHQVEAVRAAMEAENPGVELLCQDRTNLEQMYSARYTTEIERQVLRGALFGEAIVAQAAAGNDVELF